MTNSKGNIDDQSNRDNMPGSQAGDQPHGQSRDSRDDRAGRGDQGEKYGGGSQTGKPDTTQGDRGGTS